MNKDTLKKILQIDSLINILNWYDRVTIHFLISGRSDKIEGNIALLYDAIDFEGWECPERKYGQDRILYFFDPDSDTWLPDYYYLKLNPDYLWMKQLQTDKS